MSFDEQSPRSFAAPFTDLLRKSVSTGLSQRYPAGKAQFSVAPDAFTIGATLGADTFSLKMSPDDGLTWFAVPNASLSSGYPTTQLELPACRVTIVVAGGTSSGVNATLMQLRGS